MKHIHESIELLEAAVALTRGQCHYIIRDELFQLFDKLQMVRVSSLPFREELKSK